MSGGGRGRKLTAEEERLWKRAMGNAKPLPGRGANEAEAPPARSAKTRPEPSRSIAQRQSKAAPATAPRGAPGGGVDKRTAQRLRRGQIPIEGRLDLHGLTLAAAHRALDRFLAGAQAQGRRCVLVITGKGLFDKSEGVVRRAGEVGPLRREVPRWLAEPAGRARVLAWAPAQPRHGGDGALYVLLRRAKQD